jgi:hypothetical protein
MKRYSNVTEKKEFAKLAKSLSISPLFKIIYGLINRSDLPVKYFAMPAV